MREVLGSTFEIRRPWAAPTYVQSTYPRPPSIHRESSSPESEISDPDGYNTPGSEEDIRYQEDQFEMLWQENREEEMEEELEE